MDYSAIAQKILEEEQRLMMAEEIYEKAIQKNYFSRQSELSETAEKQQKVFAEHLANALGDDSNMGYLKSIGFYYLKNFNQLPHKVELALDGPFLDSYKQLKAKNSFKSFFPSKKGFEGMILFFAIPIGAPIGFYISSKIMDSYFPIDQLLAGTFFITVIFALMCLFYLYLTNCSVHIHPDKIQFKKIFLPFTGRKSFDFDTIKSIKVKGLGQEQEVKSDRKYIQIIYVHKGVEQQKKMRCHAFVNPSIVFNPYRYLIRNYESFRLLRAFLKEIAEEYNFDYTEF